METVKSKILNYLTGSQKSDLCHYISKFVKNHYDKETEEILRLFIEEEKYYLEVDFSNNRKLYSFSKEIIEFYTEYAFFTMLIKKTAKKEKFNTSY